MNNFLLTLQVCRVYACCTNAKALDGFDSLLHKRIAAMRLFLCPLFTYLPFYFSGWVFWGAYGLAGLVSGLSTRFIRPPHA